MTVTAAAWEEKEHPREPSGSEKGGQFRKVYHVARTADRASIEQHGLDFRLRTTPEWREPGVTPSPPANYFHPDLETALKDPANRSGWDVWEAEVPESELTRDPEGEYTPQYERATYTTRPVPPKRMRLVNREGLQGAGWDEKKHPRHPPGSKQGGEFTVKGVRSAPGIRTIADLEAFAQPPQSGYTHAVRYDSDIDRILEEGIKPGKAGKVFASEAPLVRHLGAGYVAFQMPGGEKGTDFIEAGLSYPETTFDQVPASAITKVVRQVPGERVTEEELAAYALTHQGEQHPELPEPYRSWFTLEDVTAAAWDESKHPRHPRGSVQGGEFAPSYSTQVLSPNVTNLAALREEVKDWPDEPRAYALDAIGGNSRDYAYDHYGEDEGEISTSLVTARKDGELIGIGDFTEVEGTEKLYGGSFAAVKGGGLPLFRAFLQEAARRGKGAYWEAGNARAKALYDRAGLPSIGTKYSLYPEQVQEVAKDLFTYARGDRSPYDTMSEAMERRALASSAWDEEGVFVSGVLTATALAWDPAKHPRHPEGSSEGGRFAPANDREFINQVREAQHAPIQGFPPGEFDPEGKVKFWPEKMGQYSGFRQDAPYGPFWKAIVDQDGTEQAFWFTNVNGFPHHKQMAAALGKADAWGEGSGSQEIAGYGFSVDRGVGSGRFANQMFADVPERHRRDILDANEMLEARIGQPSGLRASALNFESEALTEATARLQRQYEKVYRRAAKRAAAKYRRLTKVVQASAWDESKHPREPGGTEKGGQFASGATPPTWWTEPPENRFLQGKSWTKGQEIMDWLGRNEVKQDERGRFILYHATPKGGDFTHLRAGSLLEYDPEKAAFFAMRDRGLKRDQVEVLEVHAYPWQLVNGVFGALREDFPLSDTLQAAATPDPNEVLSRETLLESFGALTGLARRELLRQVSAALAAAPTDAGDDSGGGDPQEQVLELLLELLQEQAGVQAERLVAGAQDAVQSVILTSMKEGWTVPQTAKALEEKLVSVAPWQATMLARTDLIALGNGASLQRAVVLDDPNLQYKTWLATPDERTRINHRHAHGQTVPIRQPFTVGGEQLLYPGDPSASDGNVINCRCTVIYSDSPFGPSGIKQIAMLPDLAVSAAAWDESKHPREPGGTAKGGRFTEASERWFDFDHASAVKEASRGGALEHWMTTGGNTLEAPEQELARKDAQLLQKLASESVSAHDRLYRGTVMDFDTFVETHQRGQEIELEALTAATPDEGIAEIYTDLQFVGAEPGDRGFARVVYEIDGPAAGIDRPGQPETILPRGSRFEVEGAEQEGGDGSIWRVRLKPLGLQAAAWDEAAHPRHPKGSEQGGEFAPKVNAPVGAEVDWSDARREFDKWAEGMRTYYEPEEFERLKDAVWADYQNAVNTQLPALQARLNGAQVPGLTIQPQLNPGMGGDLDVVSDPEKLPDYGPDFQVELPAAEGGSPPGFTVWTFPEGANARHADDPDWYTQPEGTQVEEVLDITDTDFFPDGPDSDLAVGYARAVDAARGLPDEPGFATVYRGMSDAEYDAWQNGEEIPLGKFFAGIPTAQYAQDIAGAPPNLYTFRVPRSMLMQTGEHEYQLKKRGKLGRPGEIVPSSPGVTAAAVEYTGSGGMVCLYPEPEQAQAIARVNGQAPEDLHVTLLYFEDGVPEEAEDVIRELGFEGMEGQISGIARFQAGDDGVPVVGIVSVVGLNELRAALAERLPGYSERHGFVPHLTLGYEQEEDPLVEDPEGAVGLPVTFSAVSVKNGEEARQDITAAGWDESQHPREPKGSEKGGEFASASEVLGKLRSAPEGRPVVQLPDNPKVPYLRHAMNRWLKGRGQDSMNWVNEIQYEMSQILGQPFYGERVYDHGSYIKPPPTRAEAIKAADAILEGLRAAKPESPELWRGLTTYEHQQAWREAADKLLAAKPGDTFTTLPASWSTDPGVATMYSSALRYKGNEERPGLMLRLLPGARSVKPVGDYFNDREVVTGGKYEVTDVERVKWSSPKGYGDKQPNLYDMLVLTVKQTAGVDG